MRYTVLSRPGSCSRVFDVSISSQASRATPPGAEACAALASGKVGALDAEHDLRFRLEHAAGALRRARSGRATHCADGKPHETRFELRLPTAWSGRFLPRRWWQRWRRRPGCRAQHGIVSRDLQRGFAVVTTDAGHQGPTPEFGLDPIARVDHAYAAHERTATTRSRSSRAVTAAHPIASFVGCSGGGRQGMMFAQRYPAYFDGIVICAPR